MSSRETIMKSLTNYCFLTSFVVLISVVTAFGPDDHYEMGLLKTNLGLKLASDYNFDSSKQYSKINSASDLNCNFEDVRGQIHQQQMSIFIFLNNFLHLYRRVNIPLVGSHVALVGSIALRPNEVGIWQSATIPCTRDVTQLKFRYWLFSVTEVEVLLLTGEETQIVSCGGGKPGTCVIDIPVKSEPFSIAIRTNPMSGVFGNFLAIDDIEYSGLICQSEVSEVQTSLTSHRAATIQLFHNNRHSGKSAKKPPATSRELRRIESSQSSNNAKTSPIKLRSSSPISDEIFYDAIHPNRLTCDLTSSSCQWRNALLAPDDALWRYTKTKLTLNDVEETFQTRLTPNGGFVVVTFQSTNFAALRSPPVTTLDCDSTLTFKYWLSANVQLRVCAIDAVTEDSFACVAQRNFVHDNGRNDGRFEWNFPKGRRSNYRVQIHALSFGAGVAMLDDIVFVTEDRCADRQSIANIERGLTTTPPPPSTTTQRDVPDDPFGLAPIRTEFDDAEIAGFFDESTTTVKPRRGHTVAQWRRTTERERTTIKSAGEVPAKRFLVPRLDFNKLSRFSRLGR